MKKGPLFSFVLLVHNMRREAPRTLYTLSKAYQRRAEDISYEVIVIENGSENPIDPVLVSGYGENFRYIFHEIQSPSPVEALHRGVTESVGDQVVVMNDGARMLSPGIFYWMALAARAFKDPVIAVPGYHLGPLIQNETMRLGYDQKVEDRLLEAIEWRNNGYRLFDIATLAGSSDRGWFSPLSESNCVAMPRKFYDAIGGICQEFQSPGGGFIALDFFKNAWEHIKSQPVLLLGEGTFHQFHGGTATNVRPEEQRRRVAEMEAEYKKIRGKGFTAPTRVPSFIGHLPPATKRFLKFSAEKYATGPSANVLPELEFLATEMLTRLGQDFSSERQEKERSKRHAADLEVTLAEERGRFEALEVSKADLNQALMAERHTRDAIDERYKTLKARNDALKAKKDSLKARSDALKAQNQALTSRNRDLLRSTSWRLASPLRKVAQAVRRSSKSTSIEGVYGPGETWPSRPRMMLDLLPQALDNWLQTTVSSGNKKIDRVLNDLLDTGAAVMEGVAPPSLIDEGIRDLNYFSENISELEGTKKLVPKSTGGTREYPIHKYDPRLKVFKSYDPLCFSAAYLKFLLMPEVSAVVEAYLGKRWRFQSMSASRTEEQEEGFRGGVAKWHHDARGRKLNVFLLLTDVPAAGSATVLLNGSHKLIYSSDSRLHNFFDDREIEALKERYQFTERALSALAGSLVFFDAQSIHRGKRSPLGRDAFQVNCMSRKRHVWRHEIPKHLIESLSASERELLTKRATLTVID